MSTAKIFKNGRSQAVRLPKNFTFTTKEVSVSKLGAGVVLQPIINSWQELFAELKTIKTDCLLADREDKEPQERELL